MIIILLTRPDAKLGSGERNTEGAKIRGKLGETPDSIAQNVLPHLALAQIYAAISYYYDHQDEIETELSYNTESASQERLRVRLGEHAFRRLTAQTTPS